jgi:hypothetical protein
MSYANVLLYAVFEPSLDDRVNFMSCIIDAEFPLNTRSEAMLVKAVLYSVDNMQPVLINLQTAVY